MQGLPDNPVPEELPKDPVTPCKYSMFSARQCPKALAWMASLALAADRREDAEQWLVEAIGALVFRVRDSAETTRHGLPASSHVVNMS
jgi:hypothetical protein